MRRTNFNDDHETFRKTLRAFIETEVVPVFDEWFDAGQAPREFYYKLGELGVFGIEVPEEYGGAGRGVVQVSRRSCTEEVARAGVALRRQRRARRAVPALSEGVRDRRSRSSAGCPGSSPARSCSRSR